MLYLHTHLHIIGVGMLIWKFGAKFKGYIVKFGSFGSTVMLTRTQGPRLQIRNIRLG